MESLIRSPSPHHRKNCRFRLPALIIFVLVAYQCHVLHLHRRISPGGATTEMDPSFMSPISHNDDDTALNDGEVVINKLRSRHPQHQPLSTLVPMSTISEFERASIPGIYNYGTSPSSFTLVITGASITGDYHSPDGTTLWFHMFVSARKFFETMEAMEACSSRDKKIQNNMKDEVKPWDEMMNETFLCRIGTRDAYFELMPSNGIDTNTNELIQVWRCPLYDGVFNDANILPDNDFKKIIHLQNSGMPEDDDVALPIEVLHRRSGEGGEFQDSSITTSVVKMFLPTSEPLIGINQVRSELPAGKPFLNQRHNMTLCIVSHVNGINHWNEYIRYHHDIIGIDHIHMALYTTFGEGQKDKTSQLYEVINHNFKHDILEGRLSVSALWDDDFDIRCPDQEFPKLNFYQQCLYRAKSSSEFVATWDLDEYFLFHNLDDSNEQPSLPDFLRGIKHTKCLDWCFVTVKSSLAGFDGDGDGTGMVTYDYSRRAKDLDTTWAKSIGRTKNVFLNSYHLPGACLPPESRDLTNTVAIDPSYSDECGFYLDEAITVHVRGMQDGEHELQDEETVTNELLDAVLSKH